MRVQTYATNATPGTPAYVFKDNSRHGPHIRPGKPFTKRQTAYVVVTIHDDGSKDTILFRQRHQAEGWYRVMQKACEATWGRDEP